ncbi:hypothetical protein CTheo_2885 [Ceratobasidium theobromae]|uniref:Uncharacterized protein n=1 Tax=Ceratobasidium theobromae TaxID=1582974 RepID=A0A5N5QPL5_9AGAM|nr:hypothetical protein CTheo_2885 [Ceratobasidium theobromae]
MATVYQHHSANSAFDSEPSLNSFNSASSASTSYTTASCSSAGGHYPACPRCESLPHRYEADCSPDGRRPLRRETHITMPPGQPLRGRWEVDTSETTSKHVGAHPNKALKVLCGEGSDLQLEVQGKAALEARIQVTGRGWLRPQIEVITENGDGLVEMARHGSQRFRLAARTLGGNLVIRIPGDFCGRIVVNTPSSVTLSPNATKLLSGPRTTTVGPGGSVAEYSTGISCADERADGKPPRFSDYVHISPGEGSARVLVGDEGLLRANGLVAGVLVAKQWAESEMTRRRSGSSARRT